jgi:P-type conjugative transfer protein TrbJ
MRKNKFVLITFIFLCFTCPITYAQMAVFDAAAFAQNYQNFMQLIAQVNLLEQQANYLQQSLNAIKTLGNGQYQWSNVSGLINQLGNVIQQTNGISYNAQNVGSQFQKAFPGYQSSQNFNQQYQQNVNTTQNTLNGVLQSLNISAQDFQTEPTRIAFLQSQVQNAQGQTQALQASAQISTEIVSQLQLLRQTMMTEANAQNTYFAQQVQNEASSQAGFNQMLANGNKNMVNYGNSGQSVNVPDGQ